jgi:hypothetical protein
VNVSFWSDWSACSCKEIVKKSYSILLLCRNCTDATDVTSLDDRTPGVLRFGTTMCPFVSLDSSKSIHAFLKQHCKIGCYRDHAVFSVMYELNLRYINSLNVIIVRNHSCYPVTSVSCCHSPVQTLGQALCEGQSMHTAEVVSVCRGFSGDTLTLCFEMEMSQMCFIRGGKWLCKICRNLCSIFVLSLTPNVSVLWYSTVCLLDTELYSPPSI